MRPLNEIIVHCSATRPDWMQGRPFGEKVAEIRRWHVQGRGWRDIGYHFLIDRDGTVAKGRPLDQIGAHVAGRNTGTIGICLLGGHGSSETDQPEEHFTAPQLNALKNLIARLRVDYRSISTVSGHNQYAAKACPGFDVPAWYKAATAPLPPDVEPTPAKPTKPSLWALLARLAADIFNAIFGGRK